MSLAPFMDKQPFVEANAPQITAVFDQLALDFPNRIAVLGNERVPTKDALRLTPDYELTPEAHAWLGAHAIGTQHGYDRAGDRQAKVFIANNDPTYMDLLGEINVGLHNLVQGGVADVTVTNRNILVGGGFPHLAPGRLRHAVDNDHSLPWDAHLTAILTGQRRRWNDNPNENTADKVLRRILVSTGFDLHNNSDVTQAGRWLHTSPFARSQHKLRGQEGIDWEQAYATEAEMGRAAAELALLRAPDLFDWADYKVTEHNDPEAQDIHFDNYRVPARTVKAWEYHLENGKSFYVVNGKAVIRDGGGEPRPTSASVMQEAVDVLVDGLRDHESIIAFGAPHIRGGIHTAAQLIETTEGQTQPLHLANAPWEFHEPPITGIANIPGTEVVDRQLRKLLEQYPAE